MCNQDCVDTELKLLYYYSKYTKHVWIKSQLLFSMAPPNANIPAFKMFFCLLWENILPLRLLISTAWQTSNRKIPISRRYRISFFPKSWIDKQSLTSQALFPSNHSLHGSGILVLTEIHSWGTNGDQVELKPHEVILKKGIVLFWSPNLKEIGSRTCQPPGWEGGEAEHAPPHRSCHQPCCSLNI